MSFVILYQPSVNMPIFRFLFRVDFVPVPCKRDLLYNDDGKICLCTCFEKSTKISKITVFVQYGCFLLIVRDHHD